MRIRWLSLISMTLLITILGFAQIQSSYKTETEQTNAQHIDWIRNSLSKMQAIQVGMTRGQLLQIFTTEGGLSTGLRRAYVFRECPYIKVDVKFSAVGRPERDAEGRVTLEESNLDIIKEISRPYLQWRVAD